MERTNKDLGLLYAIMLMALGDQQLLICCVVESNKTGWCCSVWPEWAASKPIFAEQAHRRIPGADVLALYRARTSSRNRVVIGDNKDDVTHANITERA